MRFRTVAFLIFAGALPALSAPNPSNGSGTPGHNNTYTVTGTGFGTKVSPVDSSSKPYFYVDMEDGTQANVTSLATGGAMTLGDQNMSVTTEDRGSSAKDLHSDAIDWAQFANGGITSIDFTAPSSSAARSAKVYKYVKRKSSRSSYTHANGGTTQFENWKFDRFWASSGGSGFPNAYNAQNADSSASCTGGGSHVAPTSEAGSGSNYSNFDSDYRLPGSNWMAEERLLQYASANATGDGLYKIRQDGQLTVNASNWKTDPSASFPAAGLRRWFTQDDPSNLSDCGGSTVSHTIWYDDLVFDYGTDSWARVMLGNAATLAACTIMEYQPASSWSATSITFKQKFGELTTATTKYVYVFDNTDTANASGLLLQAGVGNPPPTLSSLNISTASYLGGTASTATGTGFLSGITCTVGANAASTTLSNATTLFITIPAGTSGATRDLVCTNSDGQSATLGAAITYTVAPETPIYHDDDPYRASGQLPMFGSASQ
jgi:hypothetical protein